MRANRWLPVVAALVFGTACSDGVEPRAAAEDSGGLAGNLASGGGSSGFDATLGGSAGIDATLGGSAGSDATLGGSAGFDATLGGSTGFDASVGGSAGIDATLGGSAGADAAGSGGVAGTDGGGSGGTAGEIFDCPPGNAADAGPLGDAGALARVRIVAANITSDNFQAYELPGIRIFQGLAPDIVLVQEFNYLHGSLRDLVNTAFGASFCFFREAQAGGIPNGVVSRYPITDYGEWLDGSVPDRDFAWARIDVPGPIDLWAVSVHLKTSNASVRATEAQALVGYVQAQVPAGDYLVIGGDLNTDSVVETAIGTLSALVVTTGPRPVDQNANDLTNANRNKPYDWLLANAGFDANEIPVQIGVSTYQSGLVFDSRVYTPLSEVAPVQFGDSGVLGMQHMAVVRDFALPATP